MRKMAYVASISFPFSARVKTPPFATTAQVLYVWSESLCQSAEGIAFRALTLVFERRGAFKLHRCRGHFLAVSTGGPSNATFVWTDSSV